MTTRREVLAWFGALVAVPSRAFVQTGTAIEIWKSPTCGCCAQWVTHIRTNGFQPTVHDVPDVGPIKRKHGIPAALESCHTAIVGGYAVEGHVPADVIRTMLKERPAFAGIAVPGMPVGSPGMEQGSRKEPYNVVAFDKAGRTRVYAKR
jgi:hypothetical protein